MGIRYSGGLILSDLLEIHVADQCNLSCRSCSHLSPVAAKWFANRADVERDLAILAKAYRADTVRLLGGEPLLNQRLTGIAEAVRASNVGRRIRLVSNGLLLGRESDAVWRVVDELEVNLYPGTSFGSTQNNRLRQVQVEFGVEVFVNEYRNFRQSYSEHGTTDRALIERIYKTCQIAHSWGCHNVRAGSFYKCPQGYLLEDAGAEDCVSLADDGGLAERLRAYLASPEPLSACSRCLGSVGRLFAHTQIPRRTWRQMQSKATEDLIDLDMLHHLENIDPDADNDCRRELAAVEAFAAPC